MQIGYRQALTCLYIKVQLYSRVQRKEGNHIRALTWSAGQDVDADIHINKHSAFSGPPRRKL